MNGVVAGYARRGAPTIADRIGNVQVTALRAVEDGSGAPQGAVSSRGVAAASPTDPSAEHQPPQIAVLSYRERPEVARAAVENIAAAFEEDPSTTYFCRPHQRAQFYRAVLSCLLDWYPEEKQLVCTLPPDTAAFVYVYPRLRELGSWSKLLRGGLAPLGCVRLDRLAAGMDASNFFEGQREEFLKEHGPFLYVSVMGTAPGRQGHGLGSALLAFICDRADAAGLPCYIEATSPRNWALYERFGFQLIQMWRANSEMPLTYILSRPPQSLVAESTSSAGVTVTAAGLPAGASFPPPWWQQGGQQRRQRFQERRQQQRLRRQAGVVSSERVEVQYTDLDEYGWWPLRPSDSGAAGASAADHDEPVSTSAALVSESEMAPTGAAMAAPGWFESWRGSSLSKESETGIAVGDSDGGGGSVGDGDGDSIGLRGGWGFSRASDSYTSDSSSTSYSSGSGGGYGGGDSGGRSDYDD